MFKKRYAETDLYQEYRRSHNRVKVMLQDQPDDFLDKPDIQPSAQDNLQKFIDLHELSLAQKEQEHVDQKSIDLALDTIATENTSEMQPIASRMYQGSDSGSTNPSFINNSEIIENYYTGPTTSTSRFQEPDFTPVYNEELYKAYNSSQESQEITEVPPANQVKLPTKRPVQHKKVEDELEDIIRDALLNVSPTTKLDTSDVDPELLEMIKAMLVKTNRDPSYSSNFESYQNNYWDSPQDSTYPYPPTPQTQPEQSTDPETQPSRENTSVRLDQQLKNEKAPPKVPQRKSTVKRPEPTELVGVFDPSFSSNDLDNDSSLAMTKKEISLQVKNLIRESLEDSHQETNKPDDLLELEKQLKEHINKIKQSRNNNN